MLEALSGSFTSVIGWVGEFVTAIVGTDGALKDLLPLVVLSIAVTLFSFGVKVVKSFTWGT